MSMNVGGGKGGPMAEINVTPMADVMIVLLIIFMVITPLLQKGVDVKLPQGGQHGRAQGPAQDPGRRRTPGHHRLSRMPAAGQPGVPSSRCSRRWCGTWPRGPA